MGLFDSTSKSSTSTTSKQNTQNLDGALGFSDISLSSKKGSSTVLNLTLTDRGATAGAQALAFDSLDKVDRANSRALGFADTSSGRAFDYADRAGSRALGFADTSSGRAFDYADRAGSRALGFADAQGKRDAELVRASLDNTRETLDKGLGFASSLVNQISQSGNRNLSSVSDSFKESLDAVTLANASENQQTLKTVGEWIMYALMAFTTVKVVGALK